MTQIPANSTQNSSINSHSTQKNEIDSAFDAALEELAAEKEVTVDYYIAEFL